MKAEILYSKEWSKKRPALMKQLRELSTVGMIPLREYRERIKTADDVKWLLRGSDDGFADIIKRTAPRSVLDMSYSQCINWILDEPQKKLISIMAVITKEPSGEIFRIERNLDGVKYFLRLRGLIE